MSFVAKAVKKIVKGAVKVVKSVAKTVVNTVKAAIKDPITTLAKVAAFATGNAWAIPLIDGASTLAKGGSIKDAIKVAAISYGTGKIASQVGVPAGKAASNYAAQQGASTATQKLVQSIVTRATGSAAVALVTKQDPVKAFISGGVTAAAPAIMGQVDGFSTLPKWVQNTTSAVVGAAIAGQKDLSPVIAGQLVQASGIVSKALTAFDPDGTKLSDAQRAVAADAIFRTTTAALSGGSASAALEQSLINGATKALGAYAKEGINTVTNSLAEAYARMTGTGEQLDAISAKSQTAVASYNDVNNSLQAALAEEARLKSVMDAAVAKHNSASGNTHLGAANAAVDAYNNYVTSLNTAYNDYYKPTLESLTAEINGYDQQYQELTGVLKQDQGAYQQQFDALTAQLDPIYATSNRSFAEALLPGFDAAAYRALNPDLPADVDPYLHYISEGQFDGRRATQQQLAESTAIIDAIVSNPAVDESALQEYINAGLMTEAFAAAYTKKSYAQLVNDLDQRVTTQSEAEQFFEQIYGRPPTSALDMSTVQQYLGQAEDVAQAKIELSRLVEEDLTAVTYDASGAASFADAKAAAESRGYNTFLYDGRTHTIPSSEQVHKTVEFASAWLANQGLSLTTATEDQINAAFETASNIPQQVLLGASIQDLLAGNFAGWKDGKYYAYGDGWSSVSAVDPNTGEYTEFRLELVVGLPTITDEVLTMKLQDLALQDPEAYLQLASQFDEQAKGDLGDFFTNSLNAAVLAAYSTGNEELAQNIQQTLAIGTQGIGEQVENIAKFFASVTGGSYDNAIIDAAQALQEWGNANQSATTKEQEAAIINAVNSAEGIMGKLSAFATAAAENPSGFLTMVAKEAVQEVLPLWAARGVMAAGKVAAYSVNASIEGIESWGSNAGETYTNAIAAGMTEAEAREMASKSGLQAFVVSSVANGIGDVPVVRRIIGDAVAGSFTDMPKAAAREAMTEYFDELLTNANNQRILTGTVNWDHAITAATIGAGIGAGTTAGIITALDINQSAIIGKDAEGNNVTLYEFLNGTREVDMGTLDLNATVGTAGDGDSITLGGITAMPMVSGVSYDLYQTAIPSVLTNQNVVLGKDALGNDITLSNLMSQVTEDQSLDQLYSGLLTTTAEQRTEAQTDVIKQAFEDAGYTTYSAADIESLLNTSNPTGIQSFLDSAATYADPRVTDAEEARQMLLDAGYTNLTDEEVQQFVGSRAEADVNTEVVAYADRRTVTEEEARDFFNSLGYEPTDEEIQQFIRQGADVEQGDVQTELGQYVDPRQVTREEASQWMQELGYLYGDEELAQFIQQGTDIQQDLIRQQLGEYVDPRMVDIDEAREALAALGLVDLTDEQVQVIVGQYAETELEQRARDAAGDIRHAIVMGELDSLGNQIQNVEARVLERVDQLEAAGIARDEALSLAIDDVATELGTTREQLVSQIDTMGGTLRDEIAQTEAALTGRIEGLEDTVQAQYISLSDGQKRLALDLAEQGIELKDAIAYASQQSAENLAQAEGRLTGQIGETEQRLTTQIQTVADILGKPAQTVTQQDIDTVTQMLEQQQQDLRYDINQDQKVDQNDIDFMQRLIAGEIQEPWSPAAGTAWASTGLYAHTDEQARRLAEQQQRLATQNQRMQLVGQFGQGLQNALQMAPQALQAAQRTIKPIYADTRYHSFAAPVFGTNLWGEQQQAPQSGLAGLMPQGGFNFKPR